MPTSPDSTEKSTFWVEGVLLNRNHPFHRAKGVRGPGTWTLIEVPETGEVVHCFFSEEPVCGSYPGDLCGGCPKCLVMQADHYGYRVRENLLYAEVFEHLETLRKGVGGFFETDLKDPSEIQKKAREVAEKLGEEKGLPKSEILETSRVGFCEVPYRTPRELIEKAPYEESREYFYMMESSLPFVPPYDGDILEREGKVTVRVYHDGYPGQKWNRSLTGLFFEGKPVLLLQREGDDFSLPFLLSRKTQAALLSYLASISLDKDEEEVDLDKPLAKITVFRDGGIKGRLVPIRFGESPPAPLAEGSSEASR